MNLVEFTRRLLKNRAFKKEFCVPDAREILVIRRLKGLTQEQLAKKVGTKQPAISRLENNSDSVTLKFVGKVAYALGYRAELKFTRLGSYLKKK